MPRFRRRRYTRRPFRRSRRGVSNSWFRKDAYPQRLAKTFTTTAAVADGVGAYQEIQLPIARQMTRAGHQMVMEILRVRWIDTGGVKGAYWITVDPEDNTASPQTKASNFLANPMTVAGYYRSTAITVPADQNIVIDCQGDRGYGYIIGSSRLFIKYHNDSGGALTPITQVEIIYRWRVINTKEWIDMVSTQAALSL